MKTKTRIKFLKPILLLFSTNLGLLFLTYCLITFLITYLNNNFILTNSVYENYLGQQYSIEKITTIINFIDKWKWLAYVFNPFLYILKFFTISICILTGFILVDINISFNKVFRIVMVSETVFVVAIIIKTVYFLFINTNFTVEAFQNYYPFSLINYIDTTNVEVWLKYPLQLLNLFELAYIFLIAIGISITLKLNYRKALNITSLSYLSGLFIWIIFITFLSVNFGA